MEKVTLKKIKHLDESCVSAGDADTYNYGGINENVSLPVDYEIEGELAYTPLIGYPILIHRTKRNGVLAQGIFRSSPVTKIEDNKLFTQNSLYILECRVEQSGSSSGS